MECEDEQKETRRKWHVGKEIPLAVIGAIVVQTVGVVWGAATLNSRVEHIEKSETVARAVQESVDRKQDDAARRSEDRIVSQLDKINMKLDRVIEAKGVR